MGARRGSLRHWAGGLIAIAKGLRAGSGMPLWPDGFTTITDECRCSVTMLPLSGAGMITITRDPPPCFLLWERKERLPSQGWCARGRINSCCGEPRRR